MKRFVLIQVILVSSTVVFAQDVSPLLEDEIDIQEPIRIEDEECSGECVSVDESEPQVKEVVFFLTDDVSISMPSGGTLTAHLPVDGILAGEVTGVRGYDCIEFEIDPADMDGGFEFCDAVSEEGAGKYECVLLEFQLNDDDSITITSETKTGCTAKAGCERDSIECSAEGPNAQCSCGHDANGSWALCTDGKTVVRCVDHSNGERCWTEPVQTPRKPGKDISAIVDDREFEQVSFENGYLVIEERGAK